MFSLTYPESAFRYRQQDNLRYIFDPIRKKYVALTPEEWVRQHILLYFCEVMHYPKGLISVERELKLNGLRKRYDIVVYDRAHKPWMLVECKESGIAISEATLHQLLRYHQSLQCPYWMLTNGGQHFCASVSAQQVTWLAGLPPYDG